MTEGRVEAVGETVGEAKWAALRELERRFPNLDRADVDFQVLAEGERGLMGVGREPARVLAVLGRIPAGARPASGNAPARPARPPRRPARKPGAGRREAGGAPRGGVAPETGSAGVVVAEVLRAVCTGVGVEAAVRVAGTPEAGIEATLLGEDLGLLIGRRGHTIDAVQYLVTAIVQQRTQERVAVVVDAQDYRRRREAVLRDAAERAAEEAVRRGAPVTLDEMTSVERKVVHLHLQENPAVETESAGREPHRYIVVRPRVEA